MSIYFSVKSKNYFTFSFCFDIVVFVPVPSHEPHSPVFIDSDDEDDDDNSSMTDDNEEDYWNDDWYVLMMLLGGII